MLQRVGLATRSAPRVPITTPSSTSQSPFDRTLRQHDRVVRARRARSMGFMNRIGSFGTGMPDSAAWSA